MRDQILATVGQAEPNGYRLRRAIDGLSGRFTRMQAGETALFGLPTNSSLSLPLEERHAEVWRPIHRAIRGPVVPRRVETPRS